MNNETAFTKLLDRKEAKKDVEEHFSAQIALLKDVTDYGTHLVVRAFNSSDKELPAVLTCGVLLKQVVAMVDAVHLLVAGGTVPSAFLPARAAFEASLYLDWMLFSDSERKAIAYIVSNYRDERLWIARVTKGTPEERIFSELSKDIGLDIHARRPSLAADAQSHLFEVNRILAQPKFASMDLEFSAAKGKKKFDPEWYELCGAKSIRQVAKAVGRTAEYEFFYSKGSKITHIASYKDQIGFTKGKVHFKPIRHLGGIDSLLNFTFGTAFRSYQSTLKYFRPQEIGHLGKKYIADWRQAFLSTKSVKYNYQE